MEKMDGINLKSNQHNHGNWLHYLCLIAGVILGGDSKRFTHFSAKNLFETGLMGENSNRKM